MCVLFMYSSVQICRVGLIFVVGRFAVVEVMPVINHW